MKQTNIIFLMLVLSFVLFFTGCTQNVSDPTQNTISATGIGTTDILPDEVKVYMSVETTDDTAEKSEQENARISDKVRDELFAIGISASDVQTSNFNVYPEYDYTSDNGRELLGYKTTNNIVVKTKQFSKVGQIIDAAVKGGVTVVNSIQFELSEGKQAEAKKDALEKASRDAREKAEAIADGLGVRLGKIRSVNSQDYYYNPRVLYAAAEKESVVAARQAADTLIIPEELETNANVQVVFEIG